jgi:hypothetical protein
MKLFVAYKLANAAIPDKDVKSRVEAPKLHQRLAAETLR